MTADNIRDIKTDGSYGKDETIQKLLREIAAQLAEMNERLEKLIRTVFYK